MQHLKDNSFVLRFLFGLCLIPLLSGCFQVQLNGPVGGAQVTLATWADPDNILQVATTKDEAALIAEHGSERWDSMSDNIKLLHLGTTEFDYDTIDDYVMYVVTATGGVDYDFDHDLQLDIAPTPILGSWRMLVRGSELKSGRSRLSLLSEAVYRLENKVLFGLPAGVTVTTLSRGFAVSGLITRLQNQTRVNYPASFNGDAAQLTSDTNRDDHVSYADVLEWSRARHKSRFLGDASALDALASSIVIGEEVSKEFVAHNIFRAELVEDLFFQDPAIELCLRDAFTTYAHQVIDLYRSVFSFTSDASSPVIDPGFRPPKLDIDRIISNLDCIEQLPSLQRLSLANHWVRDLSPLVQLKHLESLTLYGGQLSATDLPVVAEVESLRTLNLYNFDAGGMEWAINASGLESLFLSGTQSDLETALNNLADAPELRTLGLENNAISAEQLPELGKLNSLRELVLSSNDLGSISELPDLGNLEYLSLSRNALTSLSGFPTLPALQYLELEDNELTAVTEIENMPALRGISLAVNDISEPPSLERLINLEELILVGNSLTSLPDLAPNGKLLRLDISRNLLETLESGGLSSLKWLDASSNRLTDIEPLAGSTDLETLYLGDNQLTSLAPVESLSRLGVLDANSNQLQSLEGLEGLQQLQYLFLSNNQISEMVGLDGMSALRYLNLSENLLTEIGESGEHRSLQTLLLADNELTDVAALETSDYPSLRVLNLNKNELTRAPDMSASPELQRLLLQQNQIVDIESLFDAPNLTSLDLSGNPDLSCERVAELEQTLGDTAIDAAQCAAQ